MESSEMSLEMQAGQDNSVLWAGHSKKFGFYSKCYWSILIENHQGILGIVCLNFLGCHINFLEGDKRASGGWWIGSSLRDDGGLYYYGEWTWEVFGVRANGAWG